MSRSSLVLSMSWAWGCRLAPLWVREAGGHIVVALDLQVDPAVLGAAVEIGLCNVLVVGQGDVEQSVGKQLVDMVDCWEMYDFLEIDTLRKALVPRAVLRMKPSLAKEDC